MVIHKRVNILLHVLLLIPGITIPLVILPLKDAANPNFFYVPRIIYTLAQIASFYVSAYYFYPRFLRKKRVGAYLLTVLATCLVVALAYSVCTLIYGKNSPEPFIALFLVKFFISVLVMGTGTCYLYIVDIIKEQRLEQENLSTELSFLRSQVSPHFMFNTLNSLVSLARKKSDLLEPALIRLSNLLHYMLYESVEEKVSLVREVDYIQSYIDLQTLRFGDQVPVSFAVQKPLTERLIEPMLLIPLIENAFKHGVGLIEKPQIDVVLNNQQNCLQLEVCNKFNTRSNDVKDKIHGIGLANLSRRLKLLYPNKHAFSTVVHEETFIASLKIYFNDQVPCCR